MTPLSSALLSGGSIIDLDGTMFVQIAIFFVAFFVLRSLVFKPLVALFEAREERIDGAKAEARALQKDAAEKGDTYDDELRKLRLSAGEERDRLRQEGKHLEAKILEQVRTQTNGQVAEAEARMAKEAQDIREEMEATIPVLAKQIASKLLSREVQ